MPGDAPPPFDRPFEDEGTKQRVHGAILHAREPMNVAEIAERADCSEEAARDHLESYADRSIVTRHEGQPVTYERDDEHFKQRRVNALAQEHTVDELRARAAELIEQIEQYREQFQEDSPADVDVLEYPSEEIDDVHIELGNWATLIEERELHERAAGSTQRD